MYRGAQGCRVGARDGFQNAVCFQVWKARKGETMTDSSVYCFHAQGTNYRKFGMSCLVKDRLDAVQTGCPFGLHIEWKSRKVSRRTASWAESLIHKALNKGRLRGEWFCVDADTSANVRDSLREICSGGEQKKKHFWINNSTFHREISEIEERFSPDFEVDALYRPEWDHFHGCSLSKFERLARETDRLKARLDATLTELDKAREEKRLAWKAVFELPRAKLVSGAPPNMDSALIDKCIEEAGRCGKFGLYELLIQFKGDYNSRVRDLNDSLGKSLEQIEMYLAELIEGKNVDCYGGDE